MQSLPNDVLALIFSKCKLLDVKRIHATCRRFREITPICYTKSIQYLTSARVFRNHLKNIVEENLIDAIEIGLRAPAWIPDIEWRDAIHNAIKHHRNDIAIKIFKRPWMGSKYSKIRNANNSVQYPIYFVRETAKFIAMGDNYEIMLWVLDNTRGYNLDRILSWLKKVVNTEMSPGVRLIMNHIDEEKNTGRCNINYEKSHTHVHTYLHTHIRDYLRKLIRITKGDD